MTLFVQGAYLGKGHCHYDAVRIRSQQSQQNTMSLIIAEQPEQVFFKDEGGKKNFLKTFVKYKSTSKSNGPRS